MYLVDLSPPEMARRLDDALGVYVNAMSYPPGTARHRASMWLEHSRRRGWRSVAAVEADGEPDDPPAGSPLRDAPLLGVAYGYRGAPDQWWQQQVTLGMHRSGYAQADIAQLMSDYFELTELHVAPHAQGHGVGEALTRRLLAGRDEANVLLSTPEIAGEDNRAFRLYRRLGFVDLIRDHYFTGDPRAFAVLGRALPL